jgi:hypothetical protein
MAAGPVPAVPNDNSPNTDIHAEPLEAGAWLTPPPWIDANRVASSRDR